MIRPGLALAAGATVLIAATGQALHVVRSPHNPSRLAATPAPETDDAVQAAQAAVRFTQHLLACPRPAPHNSQPCGRLEELDTATQPIDATTFTVLVTATLRPDQHTLRRTPVPLTLRLLVRSNQRQWIVTSAVQ